jgi:hydrogenase maturation factor
MIADLPTPVVSCEATDGCITCGDVAIALTVVEVCGADAVCRDIDGRSERVAVDFVDAVVPGDRVLVHAGVALERLAPEPEGGDDDAIRR